MMRTRAVQHTQEKPRLGFPEFLYSVSKHQSQNTSGHQKEITLLQVDQTSTPKISQTPTSQPDSTRSQEPSPIQTNCLHKRSRVGTSARVLLCVVVAAAATSTMSSPLHAVQETSERISSPPLKSRKKRQAHRISRFSPSASLFCFSHGEEASGRL